MAAVPTTKRLASEVAPIGMPWIGSGKASAIAAARSSAMIPRRTLASGGSVTSAYAAAAATAAPAATTGTTTGTSRPKAEVAFDCA
jgi:hypothetical protein